MKKLAVFALLGLLCLSSAALDYAAFCTFLDVNPFPLFQDFGADGGGGCGQPNDGDIDIACAGAPSSRIALSGCAQTCVE